MRFSRVLPIVAALLALGWQLAPERPRIPVAGATRSDWNPASFWYTPWGRSGVNKGIDIFSPLETPVVSPTYGMVVFTGEIALGGKIVFALGPGWWLHYFAHLDEIAVFARSGARIPLGPAITTSTAATGGKPVVETVWEA